MREKRVVLEDHADVAPVGRHRRDRVVVDVDLAGGRDLEPGQHHQRRRLARAGGPEQRDELAGRDIERDVVDRDHGAVSLLDAVEDDARAERPDQIGHARRGCGIRANGVVPRSVTHTRAALFPMPHHRE